MAASARVEVGATIVVTQTEELVGLHHNRVARAALLVASSPSGEGRANTSPRTISFRRRSELAHLLSNDVHLRQVSLVSGKSRDLLAYRRPRTLAIGCLTERGPDRLGIGQFVTANHMERSRRSVVKPHVD